ncbi:hypothetical protein [Planomonospora sp. ID82291]|uniref:hypothetical protein n=1 Tax=Planomonospora sp. ID82291 TaxID=2738136 RepID=UPI0018C3C560|nr:hypothetical protein [Planomonospora sp. ID82291]MBG0813695.1 hypothetical protein [Planomonospora sp. ID82291]
MRFTGSPEPERLDADGCARLLGVPPDGTRRAADEGAFARLAGYDACGRPYWHAEDVYGWAARTAPGLCDRVPIDHWPAARRPARYLGAETVVDRPGRSATALGWQTAAGPVWVVWDHPLDGDETLAEAVRRLPSAAAITAVGGDFGFDGPALRGILPALPDRVYEAPWSALSRVVGASVPFWPFELRVPELLKAWHPGAPPVAAPAVPVQDHLPVLRLASAVEPGSPAQRVLTNLARVWRQRAAEAAARDLETLDRIQVPGSTAVAAVPLPVPPPDDVDRSVRRAGWLEILSRDDALAAACVRQAMLWDGGADFPFGAPETVEPDSAPGAEWTQRLVPAHRTAAFTLLDPDRSAVETLLDPETDAPVTRTGNGTLHVAVPQRLPATSPLAEVVLDSPVWVRTRDDVLYPAPMDRRRRLGWGYRGSGASALALLADRLLADVNAPAPERGEAAPRGLEELMATGWPRGTVLTRGLLEAARDGRPYTGPA